MAMNVQKITHQNFTNKILTNEKLLKAFKGRVVRLKFGSIVD